MKNVFSYIGMAIFWVVVAFGIPEVLLGIGTFLGTTFSPIFTNGLQIVAIILSLSNMFKIVTVVLRWVSDD